MSDSTKIQDTGTLKTRTHVITDESEFLSLEDQWDNLLSRCRNPSFFSTFEWISAWWEQYREGRQPMIVLAEREGTIEGIAPMAVHRHRGGSTLQFLGQPGSDYSDFILSSGNEHLLHSLVDTIVSARDWDLLSLSGVPEDSPNFPLLRRIWDSIPQQPHCRILVRAPYIRVDQAWESYENTLETKLISDTRRRYRRLGQLGQITFRKASSANEVRDYLEEMIRQKRARYRVTGAKDIFVDPRVTAFYQSAAQNLHRSGWLDLTSLELDGLPLAIHFGSVYAGRFFHYMPSFNYEYAQYSPGRLLLYQQLRDAFSNGLQEFDFLAGQDPYKYEWTRDSRAVYTFWARGRGIRPLIWSTIHQRALPALKRSSLARDVLRRWRKRAG